MTTYLLGEVKLQTRCRISPLLLTKLEQESEHTRRLRLPNYWVPQADHHQQ